MKDYSLFDIADFVMDEDFIRWVNRQEKSDNLFWENWLKRNPHKHLVVAEAKRILESIGSEQPQVAPAIINTEIQKLLLAIKTTDDSPVVVQQSVPWLTRYWKYAAAAAILVVCLTVAWLLNTSEAPSSKKFSYATVVAARQLVENVNTSGKSITVTLPDGSTVELASQSRISYENNFDSTPTRDVYLSGQAFFKVKKDPAHPFRVFANEIVAKVLGTSFTVRSFEKDTVIQVTVRTGKVNVYTQDEKIVKAAVKENRPAGMIITPNQQVVYEKSTQAFMKVLLENPAKMPQAPVAGHTVYEDASVKKVFEDLAGDYGISIVYDAELLTKCTVTANLSMESFFTKLDLVCRAIGARYEVIDAQVVIHADACH